MSGEVLFLAPHLDDSGISFGGTLLAEREHAVARGAPILVATVFTRSSYTRRGLGDADEVSLIRQREERAVMGALGMEVLFLGFPECPLRGHTISDRLDYPKLVKPELDTAVLAGVAQRVGELLGGCRQVLIPLATGARAHVDHRIVRHAAQAALKDCPSVSIRIYEDIAYISEAERARVSGLPGIEPVETRIDLEAKMKLLRGYASQPIEDWEAAIRQTAGTPPVERSWLVHDRAALLALDLGTGSRS